MNGEIFMKYKMILNMWLNEKKLYVRNSTYKNYLSLVNSHIINFFKDIDVEEIKANDIKQFMLKKYSEIDSGSCLNIQKILKQSFEYAVENDFIFETPYKKMRTPKKEMKEVNVFTNEEIEKILNAPKFKQTKYADIISIAYRTGMRIGEIMALKWEDIDFKNKFLTVKRTYSKYNNGKPCIEEPKSKSSKRRIELDIQCMKIFQQTKSTHSSEFVFCNKNGNMLSYTIITKNFKKMCEEAGVPYRNFHTLRHTHASVLLSNGVHPKIVQERLGHSKISITLDIYSHLIPSMQHIAVKVFDGI